MADYAEIRLKALGAQVERTQGDARPGGPIVKATFTGNGRKKHPADRAHGHRLPGRHPRDAAARSRTATGSTARASPTTRAASRSSCTRSKILKTPAGTITRSSRYCSIRRGDRLDRLWRDDRDASPSSTTTCCRASPPPPRRSRRTSRLLLGAAGTALATMEVKGRAAHAGAAPELGRNALIELSYQLQQTRDIAKIDPRRAAELDRRARRHGAQPDPGEGESPGDVRITVPGADELTPRCRPRSRAAGSCPTPRPPCSSMVGRPPFLADDRARALAKGAGDLRGARRPRPRADADDGRRHRCRLRGRSGKPVVLESFGLAGFGYHARDEYIEIDSIVPRLYLMTRLLQTAARSN